MGASVPADACAGAFTAWCNDRKGAKVTQGLGAVPLGRLSGSQPAAVVLNIESWLCMDVVCWQGRSCTPLEAAALSA